MNKFFLYKLHINFILKKEGLHRDAYHHPLLQHPHTD
jgi:hypothetical protein